MDGHDTACSRCYVCRSCVTGLCSNDDILVEGPLAEFVGKERSDWLSHIHYVNFTLIEIAIALHVLAIITYRLLKGHNLLLPMITGKKRLPGATRAPRMMHPIVALAVLVVSALSVVLFLLAVGYILLMRWPCPCARP